MTIKARCIRNEYNSSLIGVEGTVMHTATAANAMFYPNDCNPIYRAVIAWEDLEIIEQPPDDGNS